MSYLPLFPVLLACVFLQSCGNSAAQHEVKNITPLTGSGFAVIELFTSEGCSSCPPADNLIASISKEAITGDKNIFVLSEHVDYWNRLGWKDPFSKKFFSERQQWYAGLLNDEGVYTPQMVVNGTVSFVGSNRQKADAAINNALSSKTTEPSLIIIPVDFDKGRFKYTTGNTGNNEVLHIALVEKELSSNVKRGENSGMVLHHSNVVRDWVTIEHPDSSGDIQFNIESLVITAPNFNVIAFLQNNTNGIISTATILK